MTERDDIDGRLDAMLDIGTITRTQLGSHNVVSTTITGDAPSDVDETVDHAADLGVEQIGNVDVWGDPALLSRAADPSGAPDAGSVEVLFLRRGDTREVIGAIDRRWGIVALEKGEALLRYCGPIGGGGQPTVRPHVHLKADGSIEIAGDIVHVKTKDAGTKLDVDGAAKKVEATAGGARLTLEDSGGNATLDGDAIKIGASATKKPAMAPEVLAELAKIQAALTAAVASPGGGPLTWAPLTNYVAPASADSISATITEIE